MTRKRRLQPIALLVLPLSLASCGANGPESGSEDLGSAQIAITQVPAGVQCIQLLAQGNRSVETLYSVTTNQSTILSMNRLPVGQVQFSGAAYANACAAGVAGQTPVYVADPVTAQVQTGAPASLTLNMRRNGQATVAVDFEADCAAAGSTCASAADCCSGLTCADPTGANTFTCTASTACGAAGSTCASTADCCSGLACADPTGSGVMTCTACGAAGRRCSSTAGCCGGLACADPTGSGVMTCTACGATGTACNVPGDCCTGQCTGAAAGLPGICG